MISRILLLLLASVSVVQAHTVTITLQDIDNALDQAATDGEFVELLLLDKIDKALGEADVSLENGRLFYSFQIPDQELDGGCGYSADLRDFSGELVADESSSISLSLTSLNKPFTLTTDLALSLNANARLLQAYGVELFGRCRIYATDDVRLTIKGQLESTISINVDPQFSLSDGNLLATPAISVDAQLAHFTYEVDVTNSALDGQVEDRLEKAIDRSFNEERFEEFTSELQARLQNQWLGDQDDNTVVVALPELDTNRQQQLLQLLDMPVFSELGEMLVRNHLPELLYLLISGDTTLSTAFFSDIAVCELLSTQMLQLPRNPLYSLSDQNCTVADTAASYGPFYANRACSDSVNLQLQSVADFCEEILDTEQLGNAAQHSHSDNTWTPSIGSTLDIGILGLQDRKQPYMQRANYRQVETANGTCELEMRVFKSTIAASDLRPLLWLHGGSWTYRRDGMLGIEAQVSHFTDRGFVVFEPVYRLTGKHESTEACQDASGEDIISDAEAALDWVIQNADRYGASSTPAVIGQSAGAHLAGWLGVHRSTNVSRVVLLYPPTDFAHFIGKYQAGEIGVDAQGLRAISRFVGKPLEQVRTDDPFVQQNSFPDLIARNPETFPPFFIIHGSGDSIVPVIQSQRLCAAFRGSPDAITHPVFADAHYIEACGAGSELHLIEGAEHALDICLFDLWCAAGGDLAQQAARNSLNGALDWLENEGIN